MSNPFPWQMLLTRKRPAYYSEAFLWNSILNCKAYDSSPTLKLVHMTNAVMTSSAVYSETSEQWTHWGGGGKAVVHCREVVPISEVG